MYKLSFFLTIISLITLHCTSTLPASLGDCKPLTTGTSSLQDGMIRSYAVGNERQINNVYKEFDTDIVNNETLLIFSETQGSLLHIYNVSSQVEQVIDLASLGILIPESGFVNGVDFVSYDSIFIADDTMVWLIDTQHVIQKYPINRTYSQTKDGIKLRNLDHSPVRFDPCIGELFFESYPTKISPSQPGFYTTPVSSSMDLRTGRLQIYPVIYPDIYKTDYFGFANMVFRTLDTCKSIFSFPMDGRIYIHNHSTNEITCQPGQSMFDNVASKSLKRKEKGNTEMKMEHMVEVPFYLNILYDPVRSCYYRFFLKPKALQNADGSYNSWSSKELVLMVFDADFNLHYEDELGSNVYNFYKCFVGAEGLYLGKITSAETNEQSFDIYLPRI